MKVIKPLTSLFILLNQKINALTPEKQRELLELILSVIKQKEIGAAQLLCFEPTENETVYPNNSLNKLLHFCIYDLEITPTQIMQIFTPMIEDLINSSSELFESFSLDSVFEFMESFGSAFQNEQLTGFLGNLESVLQLEGPKSAASTGLSSSNSRLSNPINRDTFFNLNSEVDSTPELRLKSQFDTGFSFWQNNQTDLRKEEQKNFKCPIL